jgi:hypothetical protein
MARTIAKLTALAITQAGRRGYYGDGGGLFLQVSASGGEKLGAVDPRHGTIGVGS